MARIGNFYYHKMTMVADKAKNGNSGGGMEESDGGDSKEKVKELIKLMAEFADENPLTLPIKKDTVIDSEPGADFTIVETSRTITYMQKEWTPYGKLVRYPQ